MTSENRQPHLYPPPHPLTSPAPASVAVRSALPASRRGDPMASFPEVPKIISVDDHVVEPPDLWTNRLPAKYQDRAPRIVRERCTMKMVGGVFTFERNVPDGDWCDVWLYDDLVYPFPKLSAASGFANLDNEPVTFDQIRPGGWKQKERLEDMDAIHVQASINFPNVLPRFCGQAFLERQDK